MSSQPTPPRRANNLPAAGLIFLAGLLVLGWNIREFGIAESYSDPIAHIRAQDESIYTNSAIEMARRGNWLTPTVMGRLFFLKPPLLMEMSAFALRLFGWSLLAIRLPVLLLGAAAPAAAFAWGTRARSRIAGVVAAGLLLLSPFWHIFSRLNYTDIPASSFALLALVGIVFDPPLEKWQTRTAFGVFSAASILSKSVAGALPVAALLLYWLIVSPPMRPRAINIGKALLTTAAVAAPWHIYQLIVHPRWFWADYVKVALLGIGMNAQQNGVFDRPSLFYLFRMAQMDPLFLLIAAVGVAGVWRSARKPGTALALAWATIVVAAMCAFQAKNLPYIVLLLPPLAILAALGGPSLFERRPWLVVAALAGIFIVKMGASGDVWSLCPWAPPMEGARAMRAYYRLNRQAELFSVEGDDDFYSAAIPLPRVRYVYADPADAIARTTPHYRTLGVVLTAGEFENLPERMPQFRRRLAEWGLNSTAPVATVVTLRSRRDLTDLLRSQTQNDFYLSSQWLPDLGDAANGAFRIWRYSDQRIFLLSRTAKQRQPPAPAIPDRW